MLYWNHKDNKKNNAQIEKNNYFCGCKILHPVLEIIFRFFAPFGMLQNAARSLFYKDNIMNDRLKNSTLIKTNDSLRIIFNLSTALYIVGLGIHFFFYAMEKKHVLMLLNGVSIVLYGTLYVILRFQKLDINRCMVYSCLVITINLGLSLLIEAKRNHGSESAAIILADVGLGTFPIVAAGMTRVRHYPVYIGTILLGCYIAAAVWTKNELLYMRLPILSIMIVGISYGYSYLLQVNRHREEENARIRGEYNRIQEEQETVFQILRLTPEQWELMKEGRWNREQSEKLLENMKREDREKLVFQMRDIVQDDEEIKQNIRAKHPDLSKNDMDMCCMIAKGMTVSEISIASGLLRNSVTSRRCRLRKRLGLDAQQNLNEYLSSLGRNILKSAGDSNIIATNSHPAPVHRISLFFQAIAKYCS